MSDAGVFNAAAGFRIAEEVAGMLDGRLEHDAMGVAPPAPDQKAHRVHQRQRAANDRRQFVALVDVLEIAHGAVADALLFLQDGFVERGELVRRIFV
jgi:hypothetical protein